MSSNIKHDRRERRLKRTRKHIRELQVEDPNKIMVTVFKSNQHIYVNGIVYDADTCGSKVLVSASSLEKAVKEECSQKTGNVAAAKAVGKLFGERFIALKQPELKIAFDRSGFKYHGRVKALADAMRDTGTDF